MAACEVCGEPAVYRWRAARLPEGEWRNRCDLHITSVAGEDGLMIVRSVPRED
jgi:hypothetical protein